MIFKMKFKNFGFYGFDFVNSFSNVSEFKTIRILVSIRNSLFLAYSVLLLKKINCVHCLHQYLLHNFHCQ